VVYRGGASCRLCDADDRSEAGRAGTASNDSACAAISVIPNDSDCDLPAFITLTTSSL